MSTVETHAILGKVIFTDRAIAKMQKWGMYRYQVLEALHYGLPVEACVADLHQVQYRHRGDQEIGVLYAHQMPQNRQLSAIVVVNCWKRNVK